jgi:hypothetical protein
MKTSNWAAIVALAAVTLIAAAPADAQTNTTNQTTTTKKKIARPETAAEKYLHSTRLTVRRPFTDPGTETLPFDQHYHDYVFSRTDSPYPSQGGIVGFWRAPLPSPIDLPGLSVFGY